MGTLVQTEVIPSYISTNPLYHLSLRGHPKFFLSLSDRRTAGQGCSNGIFVPCFVLDNLGRVHNGKLVDVLVLVC
jgi:hypothetical protein